MGPKKKKKTKEKRKSKPASYSTSNSGQWTPKFDIVSEERHIKCFRWKISNFSYVNAQSIFTEYFPLGGARFRFQLFPKGEASTNTWTKYLGLYLEMDENDLAVLRNNPSCFICSEVAIVNHVNDSMSKRKYIFHRFAYGSKSNGHKEFVSLAYLHGPQSEFLVNGTDLQINIDVRILDDNGIFVKVTQYKQPSAAFASTNTELKAENDDGVYQGKFIWTINNYSLFAERFKNKGMLSSPPFEIGKAQYRIHLESQRDQRSTGDDEEYLSLFLDSEAVEGQDESAYCFMAIGLWNMREDKPEIIRKAYGRLGVEVMRGISYFVGWLNLMKMSKFEDPKNGYVVDNDRVQFFLYFYALKERDSIRLNFEHAKAVWNLGSRPKFASSSKKKDVEKTFTTYNWEILNLSRMVNLARKNQMKAFNIRSRPIKIGEYETRCVIFPLGLPGHSDRIVLCVENLNASCRLHKEEMDILVHYRLGIKNQIDPGKSKFKEQLVRFDKQFSGSDFIPLSDFYCESGGYIVDDKVMLVADIHLVEEKLNEEELPRLKDNQQRKRISWKVDNFLAWQGITRAGVTDINSRSFEVEGYRLRLVIVACYGFLGASLSPDPNVKVSGYNRSLQYRCAVVNQKNRRKTEWKNGLRNKTLQMPVALGNVADYLKEVEGYIVKDKIVFNCEINGCVEDDGELNRPCNGDPTRYMAFMSKLGIVGS